MDEDLRIWQLALHEPRALPMPKVVRRVRKKAWEIGAERAFAFDPNSTKNEGRFRLWPPEEIKPGTYSSQTSIASRGIEETPGVRFLLAQTKSGRRVVQTNRFNKKVMPEEKARQWWQQNRGKFEFAHAAGTQR